MGGWLSAPWYSLIIAASSALNLFGGCFSSTLDGPSGASLSSFLNPWGSFDPEYLFLLLPQFAILALEIYLTSQAFLRLLSWLNLMDPMSWYAHLPRDRSLAFGFQTTGQGPIPGNFPDIDSINSDNQHDRITYCSNRNAFESGRGHY